MASDLTDLATSDDWSTSVTDTKRRLVEHAARGDELVPPAPDAIIANEQ